MARIKYELARRGIDSGAGTGINKLRPAGRIDRGALGNIRPARISLSAGRVRFSPITPPKITATPTAAAWAGAAGMASTIADAAFRFKEREAALNADAAVMAFESEMSRDFYGYEDDQGNWQKGYGHTIGKEANDGFRGYRQTVEDKYHSMLSQLEPNVREKAMIRMTKDRDRFLQKASGHNAHQQRVHDEQVRYEQRKMIMSRIQNEGHEVWQTGVIEDHLMTYTTPQERDQALAVLGTQTVYNAYNKAIAQNNDDPLAAVHAMEEAAKVVLPKLEGTEAGNQLLWNVNNKRKSAEREAKTAMQRQQREQQQRLVADTPEFVAGLVADGNYQSIPIAIGNLNAAFPDPEDIDKKRQAVVQSFVGALELHAQSPQFPTFDGKINGVIDAYENMMANPDIAGSLDAVEQASLYQAVLIDIPDKITRLQNRKDKVAIARYAEQLQQAIDAGMLPGEVQPPPDMMRSNVELMQSARAKVGQQIAEGVATQDQTFQREAPRMFYDIMLDRPLLERESEALSQLWADGKISPSMYQQLMSHNMNMQQPGYVTPGYRQSLDYKQTMRKIDEFSKLGAFMDTDMPDKNKNEVEHAAWVMQRDQKRAQARIAFDNAALDAFMNKKPFDGEAWFNEYTQKNENGGKITNAGFTKSGPSDFQKSLRYGMGEGLEKFFFGENLSEQRSIMDER